MLEAAAHEGPCAAMPETLGFSQDEPDTALNGPGLGLEKAIGEYVQLLP